MWSRLSGSVLYCDLLRLSRRCSSATLFARLLYVGLLLLVIVLCYALEMGFRRPEQLWAVIVKGAPLDPDRASTLAAHFSYTVLAAQLFATLLLTPAYTGGAIAEDRERRTLDPLLASPLSGCAIVLGKLVARLAHVASVLLAGLPILALVQLLGGVEPRLILAAFAAMALLMLSQGSLGVLHSIYAAHPREAIVRTYVSAALYLLLSTMCCLPVAGSRGNSVLGLADRPLVILGSGNPFVALCRLNEGLAATGSLDLALPTVLFDFALFHIIVFACCTGWSIRQLRRACATTPEPPAVHLIQALRARHRHREDDLALKRPLRILLDPPLVRPRMSMWPVMWKELYAQPQMHRLPGVWGGLLQGGLVIGLALIGAALLVVLLLGLTFDLLSSAVNVWVRFVGPTLASLLVLGIAVRAAGSLSRERERQTLDSLLTSGLSNRAILNEKWLGSVLSVRTGWLLLAAVWGISALTGGISAAALPLLVLIAVGFASVAASLGMFCSLLSRSTGRATVVTLALLVILAVPWIPGRDVATPVEALVLLTVPGQGSEPGFRECESNMEVARAGITIGCCAFLSGVLWLAVHLLFPFITGRMPVPRRWSGPPR